MQDRARKWREQLVKCVSCGGCRAVCPAFAATGSENVTARSKLKLVEALLNGGIDLSPRLRELMDLCLLCGGCRKTCPSGVDTVEVIAQARAALTERQGLPAFKRIAFEFLSRPEVFELAMRLGPAFQDLMFKDAPDGGGKLARFSLPSLGLTRRRLIPSLADRPLSSLEPRIKAPSNPKAKLAFFPGCMLRYVYPEAGRAVIEVLHANDYAVVMPQELACCGTPAFASGDFESARTLAARNLRILSKLDCETVITGCATCASMLGLEYPKLFEFGELADLSRRIAPKVNDYAKFLAESGFAENFGEVKLKVTYHDPCHLVRLLGVSRQPREILKAIPGLELAEMKDADKCCGCGGAFSLTHYQVAAKLGQTKAQNAENSGASLVLTGCSACRMHIADGLSGLGSAMPVRHAAEIMAEAYLAGRGGCS